MTVLVVLPFRLLPGLYSFPYCSQGKKWWESGENWQPPPGLLCLRWIGTSPFCSHVLLQLTSQHVSGVHNTACLAFSSGEGVWDTAEGEEARRFVWWAEDFLGDASRTSECQLPDWERREGAANWGGRETEGYGWADDILCAFSCRMPTRFLPRGWSPCSDMDHPRHTPTWKSLGWTRLSPRWVLSFFAGSTF